MASSVVRVIVVGSEAERRVLRARLIGAPPIVVGEYATLADARRDGAGAEAIVIAANRASAAEDDPGPELLTAREVEVLGLVAEGASNRAIAEHLGISDQTVKFHVASIIGKLGAANRTDAVRRAVHRGIIAI